MPQKRTCAQCALFVGANSFCQLKQQPVNKERDFCSDFLNPQAITSCEVCRQWLRPQQAILYQPKDKNNYVNICSDCFSKLGKCPTCLHKSICTFETSKSSLPKVITQTIQNGNQTMQIQAKNPERIKVTCAQGCLCYVDGRCARENNHCNQYEGQM